MRRSGEGATVHAGMIALVVGSVMSLGPACTRIQADTQDWKIEDGSTRTQREMTALIFQPGDPEPTALPRPDVDNAEPDAAAVLPVRYMTVIRNRCPQTATFTLGPPGAAAAEASPVYQLAPKTAVFAYLSDEECVYLRMPTGEREPATCVSGGWVIFVGENECSSSAGVAQ